MRVYIWSDGAAMPNGGPAGAGYVVVGMGGVQSSGVRRGAQPLTSILGTR
jgi:ribonuclease HI